MAPNQAEYQWFLQVAIERLTVGTLPLPMGVPYTKPAFLVESTRTPRTGAGLPQDSDRTLIGLCQDFTRTEEGLLQDSPAKTSFSHPGPVLLESTSSPHEVEGFYQDNQEFQDSCLL